MRPLSSWHVGRHASSIPVSSRCLPFLAFCALAVITQPLRARYRHDAITAIKTVAVQSKHVFIGFVTLQPWRLERSLPSEERGIT